MSGKGTDLRHCGRIVRFGLGDRYSHEYCDMLPSGHEGPCEKRPTGNRMAVEWSRAAGTPTAISPVDNGLLLYAIRNREPLYIYGVRYIPANERSTAPVTGGSTPDDAAPTVTKGDYSMANKRRLSV